MQHKCTARSVFLSQQEQCVSILEDHEGGGPQLLIDWCNHLRKDSQFLNILMDKIHYINILVWCHRKECTYDWYVIESICNLVRYLIFLRSTPWNLVLQGPYKELHQFETSPLVTELRPFQ